MRIYSHLWRTGHYFLFDPHAATLEGYHLVEAKYEPIAPDARGDLAIGRAGLALGVREATFQGEGGRWLRWIDPSGAMLPTGAERADAVERVAATAFEEARPATERALAAERRVAELEAKLREQG